MACKSILNVNLSIVKRAKSLHLTSFTEAQSLPWGYAVGPWEGTEGEGRKGADKLPFSPATWLLSDGVVIRGTCQEAYLST